jgi:anaerobic dimethyl sulfoxide reductase subunit A
MFECRNDIDIFAELARRLGIAGYNDRSELDWLGELTGDAVDDFARFMEQGVARFPAPADAVAFARQIRDGEKFSTPSGRIEIYSMALAENPDPYGLGSIPPLPTWFPPPPADHPLALCTPKSRARTHSTHGNQPGLGRVDPDDIWLHPADASPRGIANGQRVRVFNQHGFTELPARVTDRIAPGVVSIKEGVWLGSPGCANLLTADRASPCGATTYNSNWVQVEAAG